MSEDLALKSLLKTGIVLMIAGFITTFAGFFLYMEEMTLLNIVAMSCGVIITSFGYALASLYFHKNSESPKTESKTNQAAYS